MSFSYISKSSHCAVDVFHVFGEGTPRVVASWDVSGGNFTRSVTSDLLSADLLSTLNANLQAAVTATAAAQRDARATALLAGQLSFVHMPQNTARMEAGRNGDIVVLRVVGDLGAACVVSFSAGTRTGGTFDVGRVNGYDSALYNVRDYGAGEDPGDTKALQRAYEQQHTDGGFAIPRDDGSIIQARLDACPPQGITLYFPPGVYYLRKPLVLPRNYMLNGNYPILREIALVGAGMGQTVIKASFEGPMITWAPTPVTHCCARIEHLMLVNYGWNATIMDYRFTQAETDRLKLRMQDVGCMRLGSDIPDWAPDTVYAAGARVRGITYAAAGVYNTTGDDRVYRARVGGTSAGSGGPQGTGSGIADNGVTWDFERTGCHHNLHFSGLIQSHLSDIFFSGGSGGPGSVGYGWDLYSQFQSETTFENLLSCAGSSQRGVTIIDGGDVTIIHTRVDAGSRVGVPTYELRDVKFLQWHGVRDEGAGASPNLLLDGCQSIEIHGFNVGNTAGAAPSIKLVRTKGITIFGGHLSDMYSPTSKPAIQLDANSDFLKIIGARTTNLFGPWAWKPSTNYSSGTYAHNVGNVYKCITAGASASSGGPTGTDADITDNAAHWQYIGAYSSAWTNLQLDGSGQSVEIECWDGDTTALGSEIVGAVLFRYSPPKRRVTAGRLLPVTETLTFSATPIFAPHYGVTRIVLTNNITGWTIPNGFPGDVCTLVFVQDANGSRTLAGTPANVLLAGGSLTLSAGANKIDALTLRWDFAAAKWVEQSRALNM